MIRTSDRRVRLRQEDRRAGALSQQPGRQRGWPVGIRPPGAPPGRMRPLQHVTIVTRHDGTLPRWAVEPTSRPPLAWWRIRRGASDTDPVAESPGREES